MMQYYSRYSNRVPFSSLVGKTLKSVTKRGEYGDEIIYETVDGERFLQYHEQDCCETVCVEDICGDIADIIGSPILVAEEVTSETDPDGYKADPYRESFTWTFYKIDTNKGGVTIRWLGESNGYYSESVDFCRDTSAESGRDFDGEQR